MKKWIGYSKGIDFGGWFSQCTYTKEHFDSFITEDDFKNVASWGLDHVRLPIDYNLVEDSEGNYLEDGFQYIDKAINWCRNQNLNMILDLHKTYGYSFDDGEREYGFFQEQAYQERFYKLWEQLAMRFGKYKDTLAFELLNEVTEKEYMSIWNDISDECIKRIRAIAPDIDILVGGYWNNSVLSIPELNPPQDEHIIYNFHCYDPLLFTHQGASWVKDMPRDYRISFDTSYTDILKETKRLIGFTVGDYPNIENPDKPIDARFFEVLFAEAIKTAEERNVPLYCGEYGVIDLADPKDTLKWYKAINEVFVKYDIGRAAWSYKEMDFGFIDEHFAGILDEIIKYM